MERIAVTDEQACVGIEHCTYIKLDEAMSRQQTDFTEGSCIRYKEAAILETGEEVPCGFAAKNVMRFSVEARK